LRLVGAEESLSQYCDKLEKPQNKAKTEESEKTLEKITKFINLHLSQYCDKQLIAILRVAGHLSQYCDKQFFGMGL
jgi:hypothetical protein